MSKQSITAGLELRECPRKCNSIFTREKENLKKKSERRGEKICLFLCNSSPAAPLEEKLSICAPPEPVMVADPRNEQEGGGGEALPAATRNPSRPDAIAGGDARGQLGGIGSGGFLGDQIHSGGCRIGERR
jgi:hypothetical protein